MSETDFKPLTLEDDLFFSSAPDKKRPRGLEGLADHDEHIINDMDNFLETGTGFDGVDHVDKWLDRYFGYLDESVPDLPNQRSSPPQTPYEILQQTENGISNIPSYILELKQRMQFLINSPSPPLELHQEYTNLLETIRQSVKQFMQELSKLNETHMLEPKLLFRLRDATEKCLVSLKELDLLEQQHRLSKNGVFRGLIAMSIISQSFPKSVGKGQRETLALKIFTSSNVILNSIEHAGLELVNDNRNNNTTRRYDPVLESMETTLKQDGCLTLHVKFTNGTGKKPVNLKCGVTVHYLENGHPMTCRLESDTARPFIVTTNSNQWNASGEILMKMLAFGEQLQITIPQFANALQYFFLVATNQLYNPTRPLSPKDIHFILTSKFGSKQTITQNDYDDLWSWFGPGFTKLTHQRHLLPMWKRGLLMGFISKEEAEILLSKDHIRDQTFLLRFSNNHAGKICISYRNPGNQIRHYLIKDSDTAGNAKTLVHFLLEVDKIDSILQLHNEPDQFGNPKFQEVSKFEVLSQFFSQRPKPNNNDDNYDNGCYDESIS